MDLQTVGDGRLTAAVIEGWDVRGIPHGGYLLAIMAAAARSISPHADPLSVAATYLAPPTFGRVDLAVEVIRTGRRQTSAVVMMTQGDKPMVQAAVTLGDLTDATPKAMSDDAGAPDGPALDACRKPTVADDNEPIRLHQHLDIRFGPDVTFFDGTPSGVPVLDGWLRLAEDESAAADSLALLVFSDGFAPSIFEAIGPTGAHVPTIQLTTHLFGRPAPGWVQARSRTRVTGGGYLDEDTDLWDGDGNLVATSRQLALLR